MHAKPHPTPGMGLDDSASMSADTPTDSPTPTPADRPDEEFVNAVHHLREMQESHRLFGDFSGASIVAGGTYSWHDNKSVRVLSLAPFVIEVDDFLLRNETGALKTMAENIGLEPSQIDTRTTGRQLDLLDLDSNRRLNLAEFKATVLHVYLPSDGTFWTTLRDPWCWVVRICFILPAIGSVSFGARAPPRIRP